MKKGVVNNKFILVLLLLVSLLIVSSSFNYAVAETEYAVFAGGCFWCMEPPFEKLDGVIEVKSGFMGGEKVNPSYEEVASGSTNHLEAVKIKYDPNKISYARLVEVFWQQIDPTDSGGQFVDRGQQYTTAIFYANQEQEEIAIKSKEFLEQTSIFSGTIVTDIRPAKEFYAAPKYHQDYYKKSTISYKFYRFRSGRDQYLDDIWTEENLKLVDKISELTAN